MPNNSHKTSSQMKRENKRAHFIFRGSDVSVYAARELLYRNCECEKAEAVSHNRSHFVAWLEI
jgi:hypothetical protein